MDVIGNVKHQTVKPPEDEALPTAPGHLIFDADFESGNLGKVEYCENNEYDLYIRVDTCNQKYRLWFHYSVTNAKVGQTCIFHIVNFSKVKLQIQQWVTNYQGRSLYREGMGPVVRSTSRPSWIRLSQSQCYYWKGESGGYILSFTFKFDVDERYEFAYCFPYDYSRLQSKILALPSNVQHRVLAHTLQKRNWLADLI
jgi:cytosolic carboxypeptidase protein 6